MTEERIEFALVVKRETVGRGASCELHREVLFALEGDTLALARRAGDDPALARVITKSAGLGEALRRAVVVVLNEGVAWAERVKRAVERGTAPEPPTAEPEPGPEPLTPEASP